MLALGHVDAFSVELHAFELEARALFASRVSSKLYLAAGPNYAMPGQLIDWVGAEQPGDSSMILRITRGSGDASVGAHFARWDGEDGAAKSKIALLIGP